MKMYYLRYPVCVYITMLNTFVLLEILIPIFQGHILGTLNYYYNLWKMKLYLALNFSDQNVKYTYYNNYHHMYSIIDHFILSQCLFDLIISYHSICEDVDNMSDHSPLCLCLNIYSRKFECNALKLKPCKKWSSITPDHINTYQYNMDLIFIDLPYDSIHYTNLLCTNIIHTNSIQILHDQIILALLRSSEVIPETGTKSKNIPG